MKLKLVLALESTTLRTLQINYTSGGSSDPGMFALDTESLSYCTLLGLFEQRNYFTHSPL
jgi:hypothetical protein